jgi:RHS repeat-associated protein
MNRRALRGSSSIAVVTDEQGNVVERLSYDAWGKRRFANGQDDPTGSITSLTTKGFTGHEEIDAAGLVNMGGRIYDPQIGRFMSADPFIDNVYDSQNLNHYSYVRNNPLSLTDPDGFGFFKKLAHFFKKIWRALVAIVAVVLMQYYVIPAIEGALFANVGFTYGELVALHVVEAGISGGVGGVVATGKAKGFLIGAVQGIATFNVGELFGHTPTFGSAEYFGNAAGHAVVGGLISEARGGKFGSGFLAAGATALAGPLDLGSFGGNLVKSSLVGGLGSILGGGKFQDGAVTGAFVYLFNQAANHPKFLTPEGIGYSGKIANQLEPRGWTAAQIDEAVRRGPRIDAINKQTGTPAMRYVHPITGQSVVIDSVTNQVIQVGGPNFEFGPESGDVPGAQMRPAPAEPVAPALEGSGTLNRQQLEQYGRTPSSIPQGGGGGGHPGPMSPEEAWE